MQAFAGYSEVDKMNEKGLNDSILDDIDDVDEYDENSGLPYIGSQ